MRRHGRYPRDPSVASSKDLFAWLEARPDEWDRLQGRCVAFHKVHGIVIAAEDISGVIHLIVEGKVKTKKLLVRSVPQRT